MAGASHLGSPGERPRLPAKIRTCSNSGRGHRRTRARAAAEGALARSQAARRRRVLDATLQLAAEGGFDAVQMRDVAAAADVALGTVYRYFSSKERLLLEAMAEQQADLRAYLDVHPPREADAAARVVVGAARREPVAAASTPTSPRRWCARSAPRRSRTPTSCGGSPRS